jgi:hypothetical protein
VEAEEGGLLQGWGHPWEEAERALSHLQPSLGSRHEL